MSKQVYSEDIMETIGELHYLEVPENHIIIDLDVNGTNGLHLYYASKDARNLKKETKNE